MTSVRTIVITTPKPPLFDSWLPDIRCGDIGFHRFHTVHGLEGLAREMGDVLEILAVVAVSDLMKAAVSCGERPTTSTLWLKKRSFTSGLPSTRLISSYNRLMIAWEAAAGTNTPAVAADS